jgi:hypothetical protein
MDYMFFCAEIKVCPSFLLRALRIRLVAWMGHMMQLRRIYVECVPNCFIGALEIRPDRLGVKVGAVCIVSVLLVCFRSKNIRMASSMIDDQCAF